MENGCQNLYELQTSIQKIILISLKINKKLFLNVLAHFTLPLCVVIGLINFCSEITFPHS
jgi:hypothetical protein